MAAQGLDRAYPPPPATARQMLDHIHGRWWCVYIGGRYATHVWSPADLHGYVSHGIDRFMLTYVGQQYGGRQGWRGTLTREQGHADGRDALACARRFGYSGNVPLCLDVENVTFESRQSGTVAYAKAWCETVRAGGARPGIYANPATLQGMHRGGVKADFVWVASWFAHSAGPRDPHAIPRFPTSLWGRPGERAWQYAGDTTVLGQGVDINVADLGCLAPPPGAVKGVAASAHRQALRRGDHGPVVVRLTHRLSTVRSPHTGQPYLDGPRKHFDARTQAALSTFQHDHRLPANGVYDAASARALLTVAKRQKQRRGTAKHGTVAATGGATTRASRAARPATSLPALVERFQRLDAETNHAWQQLETYGVRSGRLLARAQAERRAGLPGIAASLRGIEHQLEDLVGLERRELAVIEHAEAVVPEQAAAPATTATAAASEPVSPAASDGHAPLPPAERLAELTTAELDARIDSLDQQLDELRRERIARYARAEKRLRVEAEGTSVATLLQRRPAAAARTAARTNGKRPAAKRPRPARARHRPAAKSEDATSLQQSLNRFTHRFLTNVAPIGVDGVKGAETDKRVKTAKYYLGYSPDERTAAVTPAFIRRLRHPRSLRYAKARTLARAARRRRRQRRAALRQAHAPIEGTPKHVIDTIVLPIAAQCGIHLTPAQVTDANRRHSDTTTAGYRSDHKGPPDHAWAADMSNSWQPTPQMDELARRLARRFDIPWRGAGLVNAYGHGYRFQLIYRYSGHLNHVHLGIKVV